MNIEVKLDLVDILRQYNIRIGSIDSFKDFHILKTDRGTKVLKIWRNIKDLEKANYFKELLVTSGFRKIDRFIRTRDEKPFIVHNGLGYSLNDLIDGLAPSITRTNDLEKVGGTLEQFHRTISKIKVDDLFTPWSYHFEIGLKNLAQIEKKLNRKQRKSFLEEIILGELPDYQKQINQTIQMAKKIEKSIQKSDLEPIYCHGNLTLNSFVLDEYGNVWLKDYNSPVVEMPVYDLAKLISRVYVKSDYNIEPVFSILNGYEQEKELQTDEKLLLLTYIAYPHNIWKVFKLYASGSLRNHDELLDEYQKLTEEQVQLGKLYQNLFTHYNI